MEMFTIKDTINSIRTQAKIDKVTAYTKQDIHDAIKVNANDT